MLFVILFVDDQRVLKQKLEKIGVVSRCQPVKVGNARAGSAIPQHEETSIIAPKAIIQHNQISSTIKENSNSYSFNKAQKRKSSLPSISENQTNSNSQFSIDSLPNSTQLMQQKVILLYIQLYSSIIGRYSTL